MMKRLFLMAMVFCLLMSAVACAEQTTVSQVEQPPEVVTYVNEAGETIAAKVCDKDGNVLAEILNDGTLELTDVHFSETVEDEEISERLSAAYMGVMEDVHFSDVDCMLHDHELKVDINEVLAGLQQDANAYDLVMCEMFDVMLRGAGAELLAQDAGNYLEITFDMGSQSLPLVIMHTADGLKWQVILPEAEGENCFTAKLPGNGTVSLLMDGGETMLIGEETNIEEIAGETDDRTDRNVGVDIQFDPNFTPSVSGKGAPKFIFFEIPGDEQGGEYVGYIRSSVSEVEYLVPNKNYIIITPVSERDDVADIQTHEHLARTYSSILESENVGDLPAGQAQETIAAKLNEVLAQMGAELTHDQLVVKDLFEVTAYGDYVEYLYDPDCYLEIILDADLDPDQIFAVICSADSVNWKVCSPDEYEVREDGTVALKMHDMGAVAFLVESEEVNEETAVQSPN